MRGTFAESLLRDCRRSSPVRQASPPALGWYVGGLTERSGLDVKLSISEDLGRLPRDVELVIFRLVQECLTNVHRHSGGKSAHIRIAREGENIAVEVQDDDRGMSRERLAEIQAQRAGVGIRGMRERVQQFHGEVNIESNRSGTRVTGVLPVP
jgi:signal transduction histidine kinase